MTRGVAVLVTVLVGLIILDLFGVLELTARR